VERLPAQRDVIFVSFPYTDLTAKKVRPAIVLAQVKQDDMLICQVTSRSYADPRAIELRPDAFDEGSLPKKSYVQTGKLFTCHPSLVTQHVGRLQTDVMTSIVEAIVRLLKEGR